MLTFRRIFQPPNTFRCWVPPIKSQPRFESTCDDQEMEVVFECGGRIRYQLFLSTDSPPDLTRWVPNPPLVRVPHLQTGDWNFHTQAISRERARRLLSRMTPQLGNDPERIALHGAALAMARAATEVGQ